MNKIKQHIPPFVDIDKEPEWLEFETLEDLKVIDFVKQWMKSISGREFSHFALSDNRLMAIYDKGSPWYVIGYIKNPEEVNLPEWSS